MTNTRYLLILFFFLLSTILLLKNIYESFSTNYDEYTLYNGDYWKEYRIGDLYTFGGFIACGNKNPGCKDDFYHRSHFPYSIAYYYHMYNTSNTRKNTDAMMNAILEVKRQHAIVPYDNVLHLRVGDIMLHKSKNRYSKIDNDSWWNDYINWSKKHSLKKALIIAGSHNVVKKENWKPSFDFIEKIKVLLESNGITVELRIGQSPDIDIITAFSANYFASTGGTFGKVMKTFAHMNNVTVFKL